MLVRDERRKPEPVERPPTTGQRAFDVPRERVGHEDVGGREVAASSPLETRDLPVVVDLDRGDGHHDSQVRARAGRGTAEERCATDPLRVPNAAGEGPPAAHTVAAVHSHRFTPGHEDAGGGRHPTPCEDLLDDLVRQKCARHPDGRGSDHQAPARGGIDGGEGLDDVHLHDGIGFGAPEDHRELQPEQTGVGERIDRCLGQSGDPFAFVGMGDDDLAHLLDGVEPRLPLRLAARGERRPHARCGSLSCRDDRLRRAFEVTSAAPSTR